ncbi:sulfurtransferase-like selenium metabolism protein YedF [Prolixibacteraceae bacterium JC049]|nr:sulfurtransferase-like selenium metabolism protein YedF [Prolixibacteraceae bacterium JC049]
MRNNSLLQITSNQMGQGDEKLGQLLITNYINLLQEEENRPKIITFYNSGVKLLCIDSPVLDTLKALEAQGTKLVACKTCLSHFGLLEKMEAGIVGTMMDIVTLQMQADKVINI